MDCVKPFGKATGMCSAKGDWVWDPVRWKKCTRCAMWHSNRFIPPEFWRQDWGTRSPTEERFKAGIIVLRGNSVWMTQSYNSCYGFPKGEKERDETVETCAKREFLEETGCAFNCELDQCVSLRTQIENITYVFFVARVPLSFEMSTFPIDDIEITSCGWVDLGDVHKLKLSKAVRRVLCTLQTFKGILFSSRA